MEQFTLTEEEMSELMADLNEDMQPVTPAWKDVLTGDLLRHYQEYPQVRARLAQTSYYSLAQNVVDSSELPAAHLLREKCTIIAHNHPFVLADMLWTRHFWSHTNSTLPYDPDALRCKKATDLGLRQYEKLMSKGSIAHMEPVVLSVKNIIEQKS